MTLEVISFSNLLDANPTPASKYFGMTRNGYKFLYLARCLASAQCLCIQDNGLHVYHSMSTHDAHLRLPIMTPHTLLVLPRRLRHNDGTAHRIAQANQVVGQAADAIKAFDFALQMP